MDESEIIGFGALLESMYKCQHGVLWKASVAHYVLNAMEETIKLSDQLAEHKYQPKPPTGFTITSPKPREIVSIHFRDRVYQRSLNDNVLYPTMTKSFITANCACQKGKGTDYARNLLDEYLHRYYRKHGADGYVLQCDVKGYYPNMSHHVAEEMFRKKLPDSVYERTVEVLRHQYEGDVGYNPGSQMIQIAGISMLDSLDHYIKEQLHIKFYLRYMDDFILIHESKEYLEECKDKISEYLKRLEFTLSEKKTRIYKIKYGILFLGFVHKLTETGKIIRTINSDNVRRERRKLRRMSRLVAKGLMTKDKVDECYKSWKAHASKGDSFKLIQRMDAYYASLWRYEK